jgi:CubicO group peptidase (beta-lactamase class C family)
MLRYSKFILLILVINVVLISCQSKEETPADEKYSDEIENKIKEVESKLGGWAQIEGEKSQWTLKERMQQYYIYGLSIAVIRNYKIEWARGYGMMDTATNAPVTTQTLFQAGSISKSLNAVGLLKLVQDKKIDLYADINDYLKTWKFPYDTTSHGKKITLANLLSHTAGLTIHGFPGYERGDTIPSLTDILDGKAPANTKAVRSQFAPGLRYQYSGGGTTISQLMLMDITGQAYDTYMWENVLKPLSMTMSSYTQPPSKEKEKFLATGYHEDGLPVKGKSNVYPEQGAAGLWTNPTDIATYIIETQLSLQGKSNKVLSQEMTKLRLTPYVDSNAALGVFIEKKGDEKYFGHSGSDQGFLSTYKGSLEYGNGVVVMVNSNNGNILNEVVNSVASVYGWKDFYKPVMKKTVTVSDSLFASYAGKYLFNGDTITLSRQGNVDYLSFTPTEKYKLYFTAPDEFFNKEFPLDLKFEKDKAGKVVGFYFMEDGKKMLLKKL